MTRLLAVCDEKSIHSKTEQIGFISLWEQMVTWNLLELLFFPPNPHSPGKNSLAL